MKVWNLVRVIAGVLGVVWLASEWSGRQRGGVLAAPGGNEPVPYQQTMPFAAGCAANCSVVFPAIPAGKQLVIQHVAVEHFMPQIADPARFGCTLNSLFNPIYLIPKVSEPFFGSGVRRGNCSQSVLAFVNGPAAPSVDLEGILVYTSQPAVTITGYLK